MIKIERICRKGSYLIITPSGNNNKVQFPESFIFQYALSEGKEFSQERWQQILEKSKQEECYQKILRLIAVKGHTENEICHRLKKLGFSPSAIRIAIDKAKNLHLIDDTNVIETYVDQQRSLGKIGSRRIIANLRKRRVDPELIDKIIGPVDNGNADESSEFQTALSVGKKKWPLLAREHDKSRKKVKLLRFLANRGFSSQICYKVHERLIDCN